MPVRQERGVRLHRTPPKDLTKSTPIGVFALARLLPAAFLILLAAPARAGIVPPRCFLALDRLLRRVTVAQVEEEPLLLLLPLLFLLDGFHVFLAGRAGPRRSSDHLFADAVRSG